MTVLSRREAIAGMLGSAALLAGTTTPAAAADPAATPAEAEYMFSPGLNYLNTAALGPTPRSILNKTLAAWYELETNPVATAYGKGSIASATDTAMQQLAALINCSADELMITRSTTFAMNSIAAGIDFKKGDRVLTTSAEHEGGSICWTYLKKHNVIDIDVVKIEPGDNNVRTFVQRVKDAITKDTRVISLSHIIASTGLRLPIKEISEMARSRGILSIVDGAQAVGGIDVDVKAIGCDAYAAPGHKWLMAPKGTGFAYISKDAASRIQPIEREHGHRFVSDAAGVGALPLVVGLGAAADAMKTRGMATVESKAVGLRDRAYAGLMTVPKIRILSPPPGPLSSPLLSFVLPDAVDSRAFRDLLQSKYKIVVKVGEKRFFNGNRISPHIFNTEAEIDAAVNAIRTELV